LKNREKAKHPETNKKSSSLRPIFECFECKNENNFFVLLEKKVKKTDPVSNVVEHFGLLVFPGADVSGGKVGSGREEAVGVAQGQGLGPAWARRAAHQQRAQPQHVS
jgi:hypothetical protein